MKICPKCGVEHSDDERYCHSCGSPLIDKEPDVTAEASSSEEEAAPAEEEPSEQPSEKEETKAQGNEEEKKEETKKSRMDDFEAQAREVASQLGDAAAKIGQAAKAGFEAAKENFNSSKASDSAKQESASGESSESARGNFDRVMDTPNNTADFDAEDIRNNRGMAIVAYLGILFIIPLILAKDSKFARFHTNQGLILCICSIASGVLTLIPGLGWIFRILNLFFFILAILGIMNAAQGQAKELPIIGRFRILD